ncbi:hypothetical protein G5V59_08950 [Nocardioides sp. W3-2-3]|uniref:hypothetical protein n=1 Tax=Nocardioides convexus TaxID=2712224 RepID=UPI00241895F0|nr:hypothetical protein [Nocardioides convexus]NHA00213.1 hypothetical protein [Nocardioides convexus]
MIGNSPKVAKSPGNCLSVRDADLGDCLQEPEAESTRIQGQFRAAVTALGMTYVDAHRWFCAEDRCPAVIGDIVPLRDREHVTVEYSTQARRAARRGARPRPLSRPAQVGRPRADRPEAESRARYRIFRNDTVVIHRITRL